MKQMLSKNEKLSEAVISKNNDNDDHNENDGSIKSLKHALSSKYKHFCTIKFFLNFLMCHLDTKPYILKESVELLKTN